MFVCRTLDYIVNTDLHLYLFEKFDRVRNKGMQIEIELTEPIFYLPVDATKYIEIVDIVVDNAIDSLAESFDKELNFYMFYTEKELHLVLRHSTDKERSSKVLSTELRKYKNSYFFSANEKGTTTYHLIVTP